MYIYKVLVDDDVEYYDSGIVEGKNIVEACQNLVLMYGTKDDTFEDDKERLEILYLADIGSICNSFKDIEGIMAKHTDIFDDVMIDLY